MTYRNKSYLSKLSAYYDWFSYGVGRGQSPVSPHEINKMYQMVQKSLARKNVVVLSLPILSGVQNFFSGVTEYGDVRFLELSPQTSKYTVQTLEQAFVLSDDSSKLDTVPGLFQVQAQKEKSLTILCGWDQLSDIFVVDALADQIFYHADDDHKVIIVYTTSQKVDTLQTQRDDLLAEIIPDLQKRLEEGWGVQGFSVEQQLVLRNAVDRLLFQMGESGTLDQVGRRFWESESRKNVAEDYVLMYSDIDNGIHPHPIASSGDPEKLLELARAKSVSDHGYDPATVIHWKVGDHGWGIHFLLTQVERK